MNNTRRWWSEHPSSFLDETITFINSARNRDDPVGRCDDLCRALNKLWNAFFLYRNQRGQLTEMERNKDKEGKDGRADTQAFTQLLLMGMLPDQQEEFVRTRSLRILAELEPRIMSHKTLLEKRYDPCDISERLRKEASEEHRQLANAYQRVVANPADRDLRDALLKKAAQLIYVVRSNLAHSEKTPEGPDREKAMRDRAVSEVTAEVIDNLFDILFDYPSRRLAVYGTLAHSQPNASVLDEIEGRWLDGKLDGEIGEQEGFPLFSWRIGKTVNVEIFEAPTLRDHFGRLDRFEGSRYRRICVPARTSERIVVCNVYEAVE